MRATVLSLSFPRCRISALVLSANQQSDHRYLQRVRRFLKNVAKMLMVVPGKMLSPINTILTRVLHFVASGIIAATYLQIVTLVQIGLLCTHPGTRFASTKRLVR